MDIWESVEQLTNRINDIILQRNFAEKKAKEYEERIYNAINRIKYYKNNCGFDGQTIIYDIHLNKLLSILEGEENEE